MRARVPGHICACVCDVYRLTDNVMRVISAWFQLVDDDGSGSLDSSELAAALKVWLHCPTHANMSCLVCVTVVFWRCVVPCETYAASIDVAADLVSP